MELPKRRENRLKHYDYGRPGMYFVTVCSRDRMPLFWTANTGSIHRTVGANCVRPPEGFCLSKEGWLAAAEIERWPEIYPNIRAVQYVIMPNHVHILLEICPEDDGRTQFAPTVSHRSGLASPCQGRC